MKFYIDIEFFNPTGLSATAEPVTLTWELLDKSYVLLWFKSFYQALKRNEPAYTHFSGFTHSHKTMEFMSEKMNRIIDIINSDGVYHIKERATGTFDQEFANVMHHHFEVLSGDAKDHSELFKRSSPMAQGAIGDLNHLVHDMEALDRVLKLDTANRVVVLEFLRRDQFWLNDEVLKEFTFDVEFADICLHYGQIGKSWWEVFLDKDEEIFPDAIRPLDVMGPEFDIQMVDFKSKDSLENIKAFREWLVNEKGQDLNNPKLALGFLPLARLREGQGSRKEIIRMVGERSGIKSIRLYEENVDGGGKVWAYQDYESCATMNDGFFQVYPLKKVKDGEALVSRKVPFQTYFVAGEKPGAKLANNLFEGEFFEGTHNISLIVSAGENSLVIPQQKETKGALGQGNITLNSGEILHLDFVDGKLIQSVRP